MKRLYKIAPNVETEEAPNAVILPKTWEFHWPVNLTEKYELINRTFVRGGRPFYIPFW